MRFERESDHVGQALTPEQETSLLGACESNMLLPTVVTLALNTALRKNEIRSLRWSQIDLFKRMVMVGKTKTEGGSGRLIPLNAPAYAALVKWASCQLPRRFRWRQIRVRQTCLVSIERQKHRVTQSCSSPNVRALSCLSLFSRSRRSAASVKLLISFQGQGGTPICRSKSEKRGSERTGSSRGSTFSQQVSHIDRS